MASAIAHFIVGAALALPAIESRTIREVLPRWAIPVSCGVLAVGGMRRDTSLPRCAHRWRVRCDAAISVFRRSPVLSVAAYTRFAARRSEILQQGGLHLVVGDALLHRGHGDRRGGLLAVARRTRPPWSGAALMGFTRR